ncbi:MAG TPA: SdrD B-like domain-containing protein, partial [Pirellulaceae bacterium]|nr:SdrD B-like domain-containing protein [Pirellulaceae bacterium]
TFKVGPSAGGEIEVLMSGLTSNPSDVAFDSTNNTVIVAYGTTIDTRTPDGAVVRSFTTGGTTITGLAVDPAGGFIFWSESGAIKRAALTASGASPASITTLFPSLTSVQGLTYDGESEQLFWVQSNGNNVKIQRGAETGGTPTLIFDNDLAAGTNSNPKDIELDHIAGKLYFTNDSTGGGVDYIGVVNLDGTGGQRLIETGVSAPTGLAVDPTNGKVYWADAAGIKSATLTGTGVTTIYPNLTTVSDIEVPEFSVDNVGVFDIDKTLSTVPLTDTYNPAKLKYVSSSVTPTSVNETTGVITWSNVGPINPSMTRTIVVTFDVLEPAGNSTDTNVPNTANVTSAFVANGLPANNDTSTVTITVNPTAIIGDRVWSDKNSNGVQDTGEPGIPGVRVELRDSSGSTVFASTVTDANGNYSFAGVTAPDGASTTYRVYVISSTL